MTQTKLKDDIKLSLDDICANFPPESAERILQRTLLALRMMLRNRREKVAA